MIPMFPKPGQVKQTRKYLCDDGVFRYPDGREVCDLNSAKGRAEYMRRKEFMHTRQGGRCCLEHVVPICPGRLYKQDMTFEHQDGRGSSGAHRDDRTEKPDPKTGEMKPYNGVSHGKCNIYKGSRRIAFNQLVP